MPPMKRGTLALALIVTLTACSSGQPPKAATTTTKHTASVADIGYLAAVRPSVQGSTDADLIALGKKTCGWLDGNNIFDVMDHLTSEGMSTEAASAITTAAIPAYCPQHKDKLTP